MKPGGWRLRNEQTGEEGIGSPGGERDSDTSGEGRQVREALRRSLDEMVTAITRSAGGWGYSLEKLRRRFLP